MHSSHRPPTVKKIWTVGKDTTDKQSFSANRKQGFNHDAFQGQCLSNI